MLALFLLVLLPGSDASPAMVTMDYARRSIEERFFADKEGKLRVLGKEVGGVIKSACFIAICAGVLGFLITVGRLGWFAVFVGVIFALAGLLLSQAGVNTEFKRWQARVFDEVPTLVSFTPSFLKAGSVTLREAISMTVPFLAGPLRDEIWTALDKIKRTGNAKSAFDDLAVRVGHPCMDSICLRLSTAWDASPSPELFEDLSDQMQDMEEIAAAGATAGRGGLLALICLIGLIGAGMVFGYPAWIYMASKLAFGFGS